MRIVEIDGDAARCEAGGIERDVSLFMLAHESLNRGDFVLVHVGYAIQKVAPQEARGAWRLHDEMIASGGEEDHA